MVGVNFGEDVQLLLDDLEDMGTTVTIVAGGAQAEGIKDAADELLLEGEGPTGVISGQDLITVRASAVPAAVAGVAITVDGVARKVIGRYRVRDAELTVLHVGASDA